MIGNIVLPVFFLYVVLISGYCSKLLNCGLQKYMRDSIYFKHFLILQSIYIFTFILNWYTFDSLNITQREDFKNEEDIIKNNLESLKQLGVWFIYSIFIYLVFLATTKSEVPFILLFIGFTILSILIQIVVKSVSSSSYLKVANKLIITSDDYKGLNRKFVVTAHNITTIGFLLTLGLVLYGCYKYYIRQSKEHSNSWKWEKFIFGTSNCIDDL